MTTLQSAAVAGTGWILAHPKFLSTRSADGDLPKLSLGVLPQRIQDRKSTRLNSSHTVISYAVFCLKKKKKKQQNKTQETPTQSTATHNTNDKSDVLDKDPF